MRTFYLFPFNWIHSWNRWFLPHNLQIIGPWLQAVLIFISHPVRICSIIAPHIGIFCTNSRSYQIYPHCSCTIWSKTQLDLLSLCQLQLIPMRFFLILIEKARNAFPSFYRLRSIFWSCRLPGTIFIIQMKFVSIKSNIPEIISSRLYQKIRIIPITMLILPI